MEPWQISVVKDNNEFLLQYTKCSKDLLLKLKAYNIIQDDDIEILRTEQDPKTKLYEILKTRDGAYGKMAMALNALNQSYAVQIFLRGYEKHTMVMAVQTNPQPTEPVNQLAAVEPVPVPIRKESEAWAFKLIIYLITLALILPMGVFVWTTFINNKTILEMFMFHQNQLVTVTVDKHAEFKACTNENSKNMMAFLKMEGKFNYTDAMLEIAHKNLAECRKIVAKSSHCPTSLDVSNVKVSNCDQNLVDKRNELGEIKKTKVKCDTEKEICVRERADCRSSLRVEQLVYAQCVKDLKAAQGGYFW